MIPFDWMQQQTICNLHCNKTFYKNKYWFCLNVPMCGISIQISFMFLRWNWLLIELTQALASNCPLGLFLWSARWPNVTTQSLSDHKSSGLLRGTLSPNILAQLTSFNTAFMASHIGPLIASLIDSAKLAMSCHLITLTHTHCHIIELLI